MDDIRNYELLDVTVKWLEEVFPGFKSSTNQMHPVFGFTLLWGLFEYSKFDGANDGEMQVGDLIKMGLSNPDNAPIEIIDNLLKYFVGRYDFNTADGENYFRGLRLARFNNKIITKELKAEGFIKQVLDGKLCEDSEKLTCLFLIIYRFRNNLFHGYKHTLTVNKFSEPFTEINKFLRGYLEIGLKVE